MHAYRSSILHCLDDPVATADVVEYLEDGVLLVDEGHVVACGPAATLIDDQTRVTDLRGKLLVPGFIDCHVHYPQIDMVASYGTQLLDWLERYAYPAEARFADAEHAEAVARRFVELLLRNGTTSALVFATVHPQSVDAMFAAAQERGLRLVTGKVLMDTGCPDNLRDSPEAAYSDSRALIERWHGVDRLGYAITPRFALTSSAEQLVAAGKLAAEYPDVHVHTHLAENQSEITAVAERFPKARSYLDVYDQHGLLRDRSVFAHCLYVDERDRETLASSNGAAAFCPSSNMFLGSGLFDLAAMDASGVRVGMGSDVGGGTSLSALSTLGDAYKSLQLNGQSLPAYRALYLATLGGARALSLDAFVGNFVSGKEADFVVLDAAGDGLCGQRIASAESAAERFFALMTLAPSDVVHSTYLLGERAYLR